MSVCLKRALCSLSVQSEREKRGELIFKISITGRASSLTHSHQFDKVTCPTLPCTDFRASMHTMLVKNNHYYTTTPVGWILSLFVVLTYISILISGMKALSTNRAATFQCWDSTPMSCTAPSTAIALFSSSDMCSLGNMQFLNENCIAMVF